MSKALVCHFLIVRRPLVATFSQFFSVVSTSPAVIRFFLLLNDDILNFKAVLLVSHTQRSLCPDFEMGRCKIRANERRM